MMTEKLTCQICQKVQFYVEDHFEDIRGRRSDGCWCHGFHDGPGVAGEQFFMCTSHAVYVTVNGLPLSYCKNCVANCSSVCADCGCPNADETVSCLVSHVDSGEEKIVCDGCIESLDPEVWIEG